ncbi:MAG TPA: hypothetical protein VFK06_14715 [Candidatus Angelobacter sp.]|nr:hypothetical protein [Candidatus Angelobacter sp.]
MDTVKTTTTTDSAARDTPGRNTRRRHSEITSANVRFFMLKAGSSTEKPELGREMPSEGEALVEAFRTGQPFFTLIAWKAIPELENGGPKIVKQAMIK